MNSTDKTMNKEYKKHTGIAYLIFAVIAYLICAFVIAIIHPDIDFLGIIFVELYFLCFWLFCYLFRPNLKPNPAIIAYIILFTVPLFFVLNYRQVYEIKSDYLNYKNNVQVATAEVKDIFYGRKGNYYVPNMKTCNGIKYKGKGILFGFLSNPLLCNEMKHQFAFSLKDNNGKFIDFYGGRNFFKEWQEKDSRVLESGYFFITYTKQNPHYPETSLLSQILFFDMEINVIHFISFGTESNKNYNNIKELNEYFNERHFQRIYEEQKNKYIFFSILFFINALAFSIVVYRVKRKYLNK